MWLSDLAPESSFTIRKDQIEFRVDIHSPNYGLLVMCPTSSNPISVEMIKQYESTLPNMCWFTFDPNTNPPPKGITKRVVIATCENEKVYSMLCGIYGEDNLYEDACVKWMNLYDKLTYDQVIKSTDSFLRNATKGMTKCEWVRQQSRSKTMTLGHVYSQMRSEGHSMHKHVRRCVRHYCSEWMSVRYTWYDLLHVIRIQKWYNHLRKRNTYRKKLLILNVICEKHRTKLALQRWHDIIESAVRIQRVYRTHRARCYFRQLCCKWVSTRFVQKILHYHLPKHQHAIITCQRTCRRWLSWHKSRQGEYVCV